MLLITFLFIYKIIPIAMRRWFSLVQRSACNFSDKSYLDRRKKRNRGKKDRRNEGVIISVTLYWLAAQEYGSIWQL